MTLFALKLIAVITMVIDHTGVLFFPQDHIFRIIGRLAFPMFAWGIANGYRHTANVQKYLSRLLILAFVSQIPYSLIFGTLYGIPWRMNIFVTLEMGLIMILLYDRLRGDRLLQRMSIALMIVFGLLIPTGYGLYGLLMIFIFYITYGKTEAMILWQSALTIAVVYLTQQYAYLLSTDMIRYLALPSSTQYWAIAALPLLALYSNKKGYAKHKWWFYWFYPIHLIILFCLYLFG